MSTCGIPSRRKQRGKRHEDPAAEDNCAPGGGPAALAGLTGREREIAALIAARLTNGEIARRLFLSDGSVKQYVHQIYAKLGLTGDAKSKRQQLIAQWHAKP